jgi:hypothetical protein
MKWLLLSSVLILGGGWVIGRQVGKLGQAHVEALAKKITAQYFPNVDWRMLVTMAYIESSFNPMAVRYEAHINDASYGLMQTLVKNNALWMYRQMHATAMGEPTVATLLNPEVSMYFGAAYVNWLRTWNKQARDEQWIVESYNGGPNNSNAQTKNHWAKYQAAKEELGYGQG